MVPEHIAEKVCRSSVDHVGDQPERGAQRKGKHCKHERPVIAVTQESDNLDNGKRQQGQQNRHGKETLRSI